MSKEPIICNDALPCPFCGSAPIITSSDQNGPRKRVIKCSHAACPSPPEVAGPTRQLAMRRWNQRSPSTSSELQLNEVLRSWTRAIDALDNIESGTVEMEFAMMPHGDTPLLTLRARMKHSTKRGPVRVYGIGRSFDQAFCELSSNIDIENERAEKRAEKGAA